MPSASAEQESLKLVSDLVDELKSAFKSLAGKKYNDTFDAYRFYSAKHLHRAADGFVFLRQGGRVDASKFLVRPAIEIALRLQAVRKQPDLLYRIAFSEHCQDERLLRPAANEANANYDQAPFHQLWKQFTDSFKQKFPTLQALNQEVKIIEIAKKAELQRFYDSHYRTYCQYTHGALRASAGYLDDVTDPTDNGTMAVCAFVALDALLPLGAESPNHNNLFQRLSEDNQELRAWQPSTAG
jgi:Family of unknown function (DUF5677)